MKVLLSLALILCGLLRPMPGLEAPTQSQSELAKHWHVDLDKAGLMAKDEHKKMLVYFSGSDWSDSCAKLWSDVLSQESFLKEIQDEFLLVHIDLPMADLISESQKEQNELWVSQYQITHFPTLLLFDEQGREMARTRYQSRDVPAFLQHLKDLQSTAYQLMKQGDGFYHLQNYQKAAHCYQEAGPKLSPHFKAVCYYNLACCFSLLKDIDQALISLERAFQEGFQAWEHMAQDHDLAFLRSHKPYRRLVTRYVREDSDAAPEPPQPLLEH